MTTCGNSYLLSSRIHKNSVLNYYLCVKYIDTQTFFLVFNAAAHKIQANTIFGMEEWVWMFMKPSMVLLCLHLLWCHSFLLSILFIINEKLQFIKQTWYHYQTLSGSSYVALLLVTTFQSPQSRKTWQKRAQQSGVARRSCSDMQCLLLGGFCQVPSVDEK